MPIPDLLAGQQPIPGCSPADVLAAAAIVRDYCGWHIAPTVTEEVTVDGPGGTALLLPTLHLTEVVSVVEDGTTVDPTGYGWSEAGIVDGRWWTTKRRGLVVTITHGYQLCPLPVRAVVGRLAAGAAGPRDLSVQVGQVKVQRDAATETGRGGIDDYCAAILARYCIPPRP